MSPFLNLKLSYIMARKVFKFMLSLFFAYLDDDNDKRLFEKIYNSYKKQMVTLAVTILKNYDDAEDAVCNVFLRIAQKNFDVVRGIKNDTDLRNYLLKATKNTSLNMIKSKTNDIISLDTVLEYNIDGLEEPSDNTFLEMICVKFEYDKIIDAIKTLDEKYRDVLYYHFVLELTVPQTARSLNQTISSTKKQLVRGKKILISLLEKKEGNQNVSQSS